MKKKRNLQFEKFQVKILVEFVYLIIFRLTSLINQNNKFYVYLLVFVTLSDKNKILVEVNFWLTSL